MPAASPSPLSAPPEPFEDALRVPPPPQSVAMAEQLRGEPWFHGKLNRREAEALLQLNGDFLVRESTTTPGQYVLTGLQSGQPKHLLLVDPEGVVSVAGGGWWCPPVQPYSFAYYFLDFPSWAPLPGPPPLSQCLASPIQWLRVLSLLTFLSMSCVFPSVLASPQIYKLCPGELQGAYLT